MTLLRTLTYVVKMDVGDGEKKAKDFRVTLKTMEQDTDKASASVDKLAKAIGEGYSTNVETAIDDTRTVKNEISAAAREVSKAERNYERLSSEYRHLTSRTGKSAEQQEKMNAIQRLGAGATLTQKKEIIKLVKAQQEQVKATANTQRSMRGLRGQAQNLGWQLQDVAVQAQMGTDGLVILGQQGSQLASGFGGVGALIGAGIAVGAAAIGVISKAMGDTSEITERFKDEVKKLNEELTELAQDKGTSDLDKRLNASQAAIFLKDANKQLRNVSESIIAAKKEAERGNYATVLSSGVTVLEKKSKAMRQEDARSLDLLLKNQEKLTQEVKNYQSIVGGATSESVKADKALKDKIENLSIELKLYGKSAEEIERYKLAKDGANLALVAELQILQDNIELKKKESEQAEKAAKNKIKTEKEASKALQKELTEQAKMQQAHINALAKHTDEGKLIKLQIQYKQERDLLAGNLEALKQLEDNYNKERLKISGSFWEKYAVSAQDNLGSFDEQVSNSLDRFSSGFGDAVANAAFESDSLGDAMASIFKDVGKNMVAFFAEWAAQKLTLWALDKTLSAATQTGAAVTTAGNAAAGVQMAGINAYQSAAAIPYIGYLMAPAAATAAMAATGVMAGAATAAAASAIPAYDKGGKIPSGGAGIVAEYGDELVGGTMIYNGSQGSLNVTGREETARKTSGNVNLGGVNINSYGNASPEAISRSIIRAIKKANKSLDNAVFDSMNRGKNNRGKSFA